MKKAHLILAILLFFTLSASAQTYTVERVVDGDTLKLTNGERVRLIGIDTPESKANKKAKRDAERSGEDVEAITEMGKKATKFLRDYVEGAEVELEFDVEERDRYGRLLAYVFKDKLIFINAEIIKAGYASPMTIPPNVKYADLFKKLYQEARKNKRGLWTEDASREDYSALGKACNGNSCCLASVGAMKQKNAFLPKDDDTCPPGYKRNMMRCLQSYKWCQEE